MQIPTSPEVPLAGVEGIASAASKRAALAQSITPTGAPGMAAETLGSSVAPGIMNIIAGTGVLAITLLGLKTVITGKPPWQQSTLQS